MLTRSADNYSFIIVNIIARSSRRFTERNAIATKAGLVLSSSKNIGGGNVYEEEMANLLTRLAPPDWSLYRIEKKPSGYRLSGAKLKKSLAHFVRKEIGLRIQTGSPLQSLVYRHKLDFVFFLSPVYAMANPLSVPTIGTIWDLGAFDFTSFPEFSGDYGRRIRAMVRECGARNIRIMVPTEKFGLDLARRFGIDPKKIVPTGLPLPPPKLASANPVPEGRPYFVYPSKFWQHKNHETIFRAFQAEEVQREKLRLVLTGILEKDRVTVSRLLEQFGLSGKSLVFPHLPYDVVLKIISESAAVLMPSLLGPVNYPPLEGMALGVPVIQSDTHDFGFELPSWVSTLPATDYLAWAREIVDVARRPAVKSFIPPDDSFESEILGMFSDLSNGMKSLGKG